jgi:hypothetical protein
MLAIGILSGGILCALMISGEARLPGTFLVGVACAIVAIPATAIAVVALARRARPTWMGAVGLVLSVAPLIWGLPILFSRL